MITSIMMLLVVFTACSDKENETETVNQVEEAEVVKQEVTPEASSEGLQLTLAELETFNGENGQPAYIAVDGVVYDVSASKAWAGPHQGIYPPGFDYTKEIKEDSPHGVSKLKGIPQVGVIVE